VISGDGRLARPKKIINPKKVKNMVGSAGFENVFSISKILIKST